MLVPQENDLAVGRAPIPTEVCSPPRAHVPKYPSRPRTCARARPDFRVFAVLLPIRLTSDAFHRWQAEAKNPLTPLQRAREAKKAKKKKRGVGPWGGAVLAAVQKQAACRGAAMRVGELCALLPWHPWHQWHPWHHQPSKWPRHVDRTQAAPRCPAQPSPEAPGDVV